MDQPTYPDQCVSGDGSAGKRSHSTCARLATQRLGGRTARFFPAADIARCKNRQTESYRRASPIPNQITSASKYTGRCARLSDHAAPGLVPAIPTGMPINTAVILPASGWLLRCCHRVLQATVRVLPGGKQARTCSATAHHTVFNVPMLKVT